jgi:hypothetical protein
MDAFNAAWNEASSQMYSQAAGSQQAPPTGHETENKEGSAKQTKKDDENVENADFEVVDDKK